MRSNGYSFSFFSALLLLLVFVGKMGVDYRPVTTKIEKIKSNSSKETNESNDDEPEKKSESKEFLVEDLTFSTFVCTTANKFCFHNDELINNSTKVITQPPKEV